MLRNLPPVTLNLLLLNVMLFIVALVLEQQGIAISDKLSAHYFNSVLFEPYQVITHMFMHNLFDIFHIFFNMMILVMFGSHLERVWGARRFFIFYISCGLGALVLYSSVGVFQIMEIKQVLSNAGIDLGNLNFIIEQNYYGLTRGTTSFGYMIEHNVSNGTLSPEAYRYLHEIRDYIGWNYSSMAGASGALFGVLAAFAVLFPNTELMLMFIPVPIKAKYLIGGYLVYEVINSIQMPNDQVAHLAHVGGAIVGIIFVLVRRKRDRRNFW